jgi:hypothetical protein
MPKTGRPTALTKTGATTESRPPSQSKTRTRFTLKLDPTTRTGLFGVLMDKKVYNPRRTYR